MQENEQLYIDPRSPMHSNVQRLIDGYSSQT